MNLDKTEKWLDKIREMSPEQFESEILCLNGKMTQELLDKVMNELIRCNFLDEDNIYYHKDMYDISSEDLSDVNNYLNKVGKEFKFSEIDENYRDCPFPEILMQFKYKDMYFIQRTVIGQGSFVQLYVVLKNKYPYVDVTKVDTSIKFYKKKEFL